MIRRLGFILFIHLMFTLGVCFAYDCFVDTENYQCRLGMKTPYRFVANHNVSQFKYPGCTEKKIWLIVRHGTRYLKDKYILRLTKDLPKMRNIILENSKAHKTSLSLDDVDKFEQWKFNLSRNYSMSLMEEGENEMIGLGTRFQSRFPLLMPRRYSNETYKFKYTDTARTRDSAIYFTIGLFGPHGSQSVHYPETEKEDPVLRFYKKCPRWEMEINDNPSTLEEQNKFSNTTEFKAMLDRISQRLGYDVDYETVDSMFMMCGFATAWDAKTESPWCNVFSLEDFKVLEFMTDLKHYWKDGYGYNLTYEQACVALLDMFNSFTSDDLPTTTVYFTHSGTILKLLSLLGIGKDPFTLTHDQYAAHKDDRAWRASIIDAFGSNIAFVSYECESEGPSILVMHQERVVTLPQCPKDRPCPLSTMKALFPDRDEECEFEEMCRL